MRIANGRKYQYKHQDCEYLNQTTVVQNTWYTALDTVVNAKLVAFRFYQNNDETNAKNIEVQWIIDGVTYTEQVGNAANGATTYIRRKFDAVGSATDGLFGNTTDARTLSLWEACLECQSLKIQIRCTSAVGTNQRIRAYTIYELLEVV